MMDSVVKDISQDILNFNRNYGVISSTNNMLNKKPLLNCNGFLFCDSSSVHGANSSLIGGYFILNEHY